MIDIGMIFGVLSVIINLGGGALFFTTNIFVIITTLLMLSILLYIVLKINCII